MSAWIAEVVFPDLLSVTVLRDPVERTISHLRQIADLPQTSDDLEAIYEDPIWRSRLLDHQVQVFAAAPQERPATREERQAYNPGRYEEPERSRLRQQLWAAFATAISEPQVIDEASYAEASARLDRVDEVGVTEQLDAVMSRVAARAGLGALGHPAGQRLGAARRRPRRTAGSDRTGECGLAGARDGLHCRHRLARLGLRGRQADGEEGVAIGDDGDLARRRGAPIRAERAHGVGARGQRGQEETAGAVGQRDQAGTADAAAEQRDDRAGDRKPFGVLDKADEPSPAFDRRSERRREQQEEDRSASSPVAHVRLSRVLSRPAPGKLRRGLMEDARSASGESPPVEIQTSGPRTRCQHRTLPGPRLAGRAGRGPGAVPDRFMAVARRLVL